MSFSLRSAVFPALVLSAIVASGVCRAQEPDAPGSSDHPLVGRYEGAFIKIYQVKGYEELALPIKPVTPDNAANTDAHSMRLAGKLTRILYEGPAGRSALEVVRNFQKKLEGEGFTTQFSCRREECGDVIEFFGRGAPEGGQLTNWDTVTYIILKKADPKGDVWASFQAIEFGDAPLSTQTAVNVVELQPMETDKIVVRDASTMQQAIASDGRIALYGIYFDFDKAEVKPESDPQIAEIAKLLQAEPGLNVYVVGHTDGKGSQEYNLALSQRRAEAVVAVLAGRHGIAPDRVVPAGVGMLAPVASNAMEEGRAKNRRVEIVGRQ